jgi:hypothetical protein
MRRTILLAAALSIAAGQAALAETWTEVAKDAHFTLMFDKDSIERTGGHAKFWDKVLLATPPKGRDFDQSFSEARFQRDMDCPGRTVSTVAERFFDDKGAMVHSADRVEPVQPIGAGSPAELELKQVCG